MTTPRRVGLLGGAFNPPHLGHLRLAVLALEHLALDELRFVPTANSPHKPPPDGGAALRLRLLRAALEGMPGSCRVEPIELERGGTSYTADTLEALALREPGTTWIWLMGSDQLESFDHWKNGPRILELASLGIAPRPGYGRTVPEPLADLQREVWSGAPGELVWLPSTELQLSSSELRVGLFTGSVTEGLPIEVRAAIDRENLYR